MNKGFQECGSCDHWTGSRDVNSSNQAVIDDMQAKGKCLNENNTNGYRQMLAATGSSRTRCWKVWKAIK